MAVSPLPPIRPIGNKPIGNSGDINKVLDKTKSILGEPKHIRLSLDEASKIFDKALKYQANAKHTRQSL